MGYCITPRGALKLGVMDQSWAIMEHLFRTGARFFEREVQQQPGSGSRESAVSINAHGTSAGSRGKKKKI